jgi:hypothetical protein
MIWNDSTDDIGSLEPDAEYESERGCHAAAFRQPASQPS